MHVYGALRHYWDEDAMTYDLSPERFPQAKAQEAAWNAALTRHLPPPPAHVLDVGVVEAAGWDYVRLERLRDVEWVRAMMLPPLERMLWVTPEFVVVADDTTDSSAPTRE